MVKRQGAIAKLITVAQTKSETLSQDNVTATQSYHKAKVFIIKSVQRQAFCEDIERVKRSGKVSRLSVLEKLSLKIDGEGILRVGGRLNQVDLANEERNPIILPRSSHLSPLLIRHYHERVQHQERVLTHDALRRSGYWILGGKRLINSIIEKCVKCKKLRGQCQIQKMADLPVDRISPAPPFSYVGLVVFDPWQICARRTQLVTPLNVR